MKLLIEISFDFIHMMGGQIVNFRHLPVCEAAGLRYQVLLQAC